MIDCGVLPTPVKASKVLETHTRVDGMVRFKCTEKGYEISGSEIRKCLNTGLWSGTTTKCTSKFDSKKNKSINKLNIFTVKEKKKNHCKKSIYSHGKIVLPSYLNSNCIDL